MIVTPPGCEKVVSKEQITKGKAEQVDKGFIPIGEEEKEEVGGVPAWFLWFLLQTLSFFCL